MIQCPVCRTLYVANTIYCVECGAYLPKAEKVETDPILKTQIDWVGGPDAVHEHMDPPGTGPLTIHLHIGRGNRQRELEVSLIKPIRLGRNDPTQDIFPEVDLTDDLGIEYGVSREHVCIFRQGNTIKVEDLGSTNGTILNGEQLDPYTPTQLKHGDQLQLGKLLVEVWIL